MIVPAQGLASVAAQAPSGWLVDRSTKKKWLVVVAALIVSSGCVPIVVAPNIALELLAQVLIGVTASIFPPSIAAIPLGIVGKAALSSRAGRNEGFNHSLQQVETPGCFGQVGNDNHPQHPKDGGAHAI
jgi:MFS family permease